MFGSATSAQKVKSPEYYESRKLQNMFWLSAFKYWLLCSASRIVWRTASTRAARRDSGWGKRRSTYSGLICLAASIHMIINHCELYEQLEKPSPGSDVGSIEILRAGRTPSGSGGMDMSPGLGKLYLISQIDMKAVIHHQWAAFFGKSVQNLCLGHHIDTSLSVPPDLSLHTQIWFLIYHCTLQR